VYELGICIHIHEEMASKNLTVREEVYNKLLEAKKENESFSDVIERLLEGKRDLMSFAGIFSKDRKFEEATRDIRKVRKRVALRKLD
jgi:predicted CopG family antitoxin